MKRKSCEKKFLKFQRQKKENDESFLRLVFLCFIIFVFVSVVFLSRSADAIPVFARKYQTACTTCHFVAFPQLNAFGRAFKESGYRMPDDEVFVKDSPVSMGAEPWKKLWPEAVWPSDIPGLPPIGIEFSGNFVVHPHRGDSGKTEFQGMLIEELVTAGTFGESFSFFALTGIYNGTDNISGSGTNLQRGFLVYSPQFWNLSGHVNLRVGRFEPRAAPFRDHLSLLADLAPDFADTWSVVPASNANTMWPNQNGVELFGAFNGPGGKGGLRWGAGVVNGEPTGDGLGGFSMNGDPSGGGVLTSDVMTAVRNKWTGHFDINNDKDYYGRVEYKIGGMGVLGGSTTETSPKMTQNWQDPSLTLGTFFYRGTTGAFRDFTMYTPALGPASLGGFDANADHFWRYGGEATVNWWNVELAGAATFYRDTVDGGVKWVDGSTGSNFNTDIYTFKADWVALPWLVPSYRFEHVEPRYDVGNWHSINRHTVLLTAVIRANVKVYAGATFTSGIDLKGGDALGSAFDDTLTLGFRFAF